MLNPIKNVFFISLVLTAVASSNAHATTTLAVSDTSLRLAPPTTPVSTTQITEDESLKKLKKSFGVTYFSFFYGPGLHPDSLFYSPNQFGKNEKFGLYFKNNLSLRFKFSENLAVDLQTRFNVFLTNQSEDPRFQIATWEAPRIGISGKLVGGKDWAITGAFNTDFPYFLPSPLSGFEVQQRQVIFNPGFFANFNWEPSGSRWSVFSVLSPRMFIYADRNAVEPNFLKNYDPQNKPEFILSLQPTINYRLTDLVSLSLGTTIDYRKHVLSSWNPFKASLASNGNDPAWRLAPLNLYFGATFKVSPMLTIFPFIATYPIAEQRIDTSAAPGTPPASLLSTTSIGMWIRGTIL